MQLRHLLYQDYKGKGWGHGHTCNMELVYLTRAQDMDDHVLALVTAATITTIQKHIKFI